MDEWGSDAIGALRWGLARYAWLFLLYVVLLTVLVPVVASRASTNYDAEALVVAQRLDMALVALPRYGEAAFDNGQVARAIAAEFGDTGGLEDIIPRRASLVAEQDSIVLRVVGHDADPGVAAEVANTAADAFLNELNAPGEGVGAFTLQSRAVPPSEPTDGLPGARFLIPVGLLAGAALGLAAVAVVLVSRRPVLEPADAEQATGVPVLASITLPRVRKGAVSSDDVAGLVPLCRRILTLDTDVIVLVGTASAETAKSQLAGALARVLAQVTEVRHVSDDGQEAVSSGLSDAREPITLIDSSHPLDLMGVEAAAATILLVPHGMPVRALRDAVTEHLGGGPGALVMVKRGRRRARRVTPAPQHADTGSTADAERRHRSVASVER